MRAELLVIDDNNESVRLYAETDKEFDMFDKLWKFGVIACEISKKNKCVRLIVKR